MADFPPPARTNVPASELLHRAVDKSYEDLRSVVHSLPSLPEQDRPEPLLQQLRAARQRFAHLLAVVKWSAQSPLLKRCESLKQHAEGFRNQTNETNDRLFFLHADLNRAKERRYDVSTAVDVLFSGTYLRFPRIAHQALYPRELPAVDTAAAAKEVEDLIHFRLIEARLPSQLTSVELDGNGFVTCEAEGEFSIVLTLQGKERDAPWRVVSVKTALTDANAFAKHASSASTSALRIIKANAPSTAHCTHLRNLVQRTMSHSDEPFVDAVHVMRDFCSALALQIVSAQGKLLMDGRWKNRLLVKHHREANVVDLCYWPNACLKSEAPSSDTPPFPESSLCVRLNVDPSKKKLLAVTLQPSLPPNLPNKAQVMDMLSVPSNMFLLSCENLLLSAMRAHAAATLFCLGRMLFVDSPQPHPISSRLVSGESVEVEFSNTNLKVSRADIGGLQESLDIGFDVRSGKFTASCAAASKSPALSTSVQQLERALETTCKIALTGRSHRQERTKALPPLELVPSDSNRGLEAVHTSVRKALCEVVAFEIAQVGMAMQGVDVLRNVSLNWDRYVAFRKDHGGQTEDLTISDSALFFQLKTSKESTCYLVIETDRHAEVEGASAKLKNADLDFIRLPCFSLLLSSISVSGQPAGVQFVQKFPAIRQADVHPALLCQHIGRKRPLEGSDGGKPHVASVLLHVINMCRERVQLQHFVNFARRRKCKIQYSGEAGTRDRRGTGNQVVTLSFPDKVDVEPLQVGAILGHLQPGYGVELVLHLRSPPFTFIRPKDAPACYLWDQDHFVNDKGQLVFRYSSTAVMNGLLHENPLEMFMVELVCAVQPLCELGVKLERMLTKVGRYTNDMKEDGHFYVERSDPFAIVLAAKTRNPRQRLAAGASADGSVTYRVAIQFKQKQKQKMGFVVNYSHEAEHPLMHFIQSALNGHSDPAQLLEALERTCIPLGILSSVVESQLLCVKYYRQPVAQKETSGPKKSGGKGGKGMKLGYKVKLPGEESEYYSEKSYGRDDKSFVPAELVLIPRSQTHVRLSYADRSAVDIYFLENRMVKLQSASGGVRVPSCPAEKGVTVDYENFADKLRNVLAEMASV